MFSYKKIVVSLGYIENSYPLSTSTLLPSKSNRLLQANP